ncbi:MAG: alpha/beta fold hydrolase [Alsobacter sp.]
MSATLPRSRTPGGTAFHEAGRGEPLVLLHGVGMRLEAWAPQIRALAASHRVVAVDMPGHGESARLRAGSQLPDFVSWLAGFLDERGLGPVSIAGHSMGALIAGGAAATLGDAVARVALVNGVYRRSAEARAAVLARAEEIEKGAIDLTGPLRRWFSPSEAGSEACRLVKDWLASVDRAGYATAYRAFAQGDETYADAWPRVRCPALFLTGSDDPNSTPDMSRAMAQAAPRGEAVVIEGHRHMVNLTAPDRVNAALAAWLKR